MNKCIDLFSGDVLLDHQILVDPEENKDIFSQHIVLFFSEGQLSVKIDTEFDELIIEAQPGKRKKHIDGNLFRSSLIDRYHNQKMISFWLPKNDQGYNDSLIFAFKYFIPSFMFFGISSNILIYGFENFTCYGEMKRI